MENASVWIGIFAHLKSHVTWAKFSIAIYSTVVKMTWATCALGCRM
jgi:hypothetical protein